MIIQHSEIVFKIINSRWIFIKDSPYKHSFENKSSVDCIIDQIQQSMK